MALDHAAYQFRGNAYRQDLVELNAWTRQRHEPALEPDLPIIDPHHHVWDHRRSRYLLDELIEDTATGHNIVATVFIECGAMYRADGTVEMKPVGEVEFVNGLAAMSASGRYGKSRLCAGIVGHADLTLGERARPVLEALIAAGNGRLRGVRHGVTWDTGNAAHFSRLRVPPHLVLDPRFRRGFACLAPLGLSFESWQFHPQLPDLVELLRESPATNVILNHAGGLLGIPPHDGDRAAVFDIWRGHMRELVQFPNLSVKLGGLGMLYCGFDFHLRDMPPASEELAAAWRPYIETCIELFGVERCMLESNFPVDKQSCGYGVLWNAFKRITAGCSPAEKAALYHDTARRVYRLSV
ncbi:MAG: amidohydrolase family protein [Burkholderiales bacterium]|nr:amidohydrolase family protein [Burkholderiales bacterium]